MERILLVMAAADEAAAAESLRTAAENAHAPETLSLGLLLPEVPAEAPERPRQGSVIMWAFRLNWRSPQSTRGFATRASEIRFPWLSADRFEALPTS